MFSEFKMIIFGLSFILYVLQLPGRNRFIYNEQLTKNECIVSENKEDLFLYTIELCKVSQWKVSIVMKVYPKF